MIHLVTTNSTSIGMFNFVSAFGAEKIFNPYFHSAFDYGCRKTIFLFKDDAKPYQWRLERLLPQDKYLLASLSIRQDNKWGEIQE